jgi:hypothetical protein
MMMQPKSICHGNSLYCCIEGLRCTRCSIQTQGRLMLWWLTIMAHLPSGGAVLPAAFSTAFQLYPKRSIVLRNVV